jgi:hypothetical protein
VKGVEKKLIVKSEILESAMPMTLIKDFSPSEFCSQGNKIPKYSGLSLTLQEKLASF